MWSDEILVVARLVLAAVFVVAAIGKLLEPRASREAIRAFGVPEPLAGPAARVLPVVELAVAAALLAATTAAWAAVAAGGLLLVFSAAIAVNLASGRRPECQCFGGLRAAPIGRGTLVRNAALLAPAVLVVAAPGDDAGPSAVAWVADLGTGAAVAVAVAVAVCAAAAVVVREVLRRYGRVLLHVDALEATLAAHGIRPPSSAPAPDGVFVTGLTPGGAAPDFALPDVRGGTVSLAQLRERSTPVLLVFASPGCQPCRDLLPAIGDWQRRHAAQVTLAVVGAGDFEANAALAAEHGVETLLVQAGQEVAEAYRITATPSAVVVTADGRVAGAVAQGAGAIERLLDGIVRTPVLRLTPPRGATVAAEAGRA